MSVAEEYCKDCGKLIYGTAEIVSGRILCAVCALKSRQIKSVDSGSKPKAAGAAADVANALFAIVRMLVILIVAGSVGLGILAMIFSSPREFQDDNAYGATADGVAHLVAIAQAAVFVLLGGCIFFGVLLYFINNKLAEISRKLDR